MKTNPALDKEWASPEVGEKLNNPGLGQLVSCSIPAPGLKLDTFLKQAEGKSRFFWQRGGQDELYAGFGTAVQLIAWGENRFQEIEQKARQLFEQAQIVGEHSAPILPRLFGGFSFRDDFTADNTWAAFHPAHFVLPHYQFVQTGDSSWLTINALIPEVENLDEIGLELHEALVARYQYLIGNERESNLVEKASEFEVRYPMPFEIWEELVNNATQTMVASELNKVVLARVCEIKAKNRIDICQALSFLNATYQECTRFLFEPRPYHAFYGATPEILIRLEGKDFTTMALAGSMPRGKTADEDQANAGELFSSRKERHEHQLVTQAIRRRLEPVTSHLNIPDAPDVYRLSYIQHLMTPITGTLNKQSGILPLVQLLHPTPAMGGSPRDLAMDFIRENEPVPRGWYAAPVGWIDSQGDGEFIVAIRSAVAQERRVWCYAGAGIVLDSQPDREWHETDLKFQPMLRALNVYRI
ncbi:MAG: isochorismate synthase MenF [Candidatus Promineifilaceae bacterium]|jgi:menaquinone-specific isochorismate synthase